MFEGLGIEWAGTLLGCFAALLVPIPVCFILFGRKLREKSKFAPTMKRKPPQEESSDDEEEHHEFVALAATRSRAHTGDPTVRSRASAANGPNGTAASRASTNANNPDLEKGETTGTSSGAEPGTNTKAE